MTTNQSPTLPSSEEVLSLVNAPVGILDGAEDGFTMATSPNSNAATGNPSPKFAFTQPSVHNLGVLQVPDLTHYAGRSGMVQCTMSERDGGNKIVMSYQLENGVEIPVLMAERQKTVKVLPKYHIFDISATGDTHAKLTKEDPQFLGKVRRDKNIRIHAFALSVPFVGVGLEDSTETNNMEQVMYVLYDLPSLTSVLLRKDPPRRAQVAIYDETSDEDGLGNRLSHMVTTSKKATGHLDQVAAPSAGLFAFANKEPYKKANGDLALNFGGRCRRAHSSNMIVHGDAGTVLLQVCKWGNKKFHVDFKAPFNAFKAFGFAIAQICDY